MSDRRRFRMEVLYRLPLLLVLVLVGCTGANGSRQSGAPSTASPSPPVGSLSPLDAVTTAAARTFSTGTFHLVSGFEVIGRGERIGFTSDGDVDIDAEAIAMTSTFEDFPGMPPNAEVEIVIIGTRVWMRAAFLGKGNVWYTFDAQEAADEFPQLVGIGSGMNDPRVASNFLAGAEAMRASGTEQHNGETMSRYIGRVDFEKAADAVPPDDAEGLEQALQPFSDLGLNDAETSVWIDEAGYVREIRYVLVPPPAAESAGYEMTISSVISDIGQDKRITPPTDDVVDITEAGAGT